MKKLIFIILIGLIAMPVRADQVWTFESKPTDPWDSLSSIASFNSQLYVVGHKKGTSSSTGVTCWRSADGIQWTEFQIEQFLNSVEFVTHKGQLFAIGFRQTGSHCVYRTVNGTNWDFVFATPTPYYSALNAISDGNVITMVAGSNVLQSAGDNITSPWIIFSAPPGSLAWKLGYYKGALHAVASTISDIIVYRLKSDLTWELAGTYSVGNIGTVYLTAHAGRLFIFGNGVWQTNGESFPYVFEKENEFVSGICKAYVLLGELYVASIANPILKWTDEGNWERVSRTNFSVNYLFGLALLSNDVYVVTTGLWKMKRGIHQLNSTGVSKLIIGQKDIELMALQIEANIDEQLNLTATASNLENIRIVHNGLTTPWQATNAITVKDNERISIVADVASNAFPGANANFVINGFNATYNTNFSPPPLSINAVLDVGPNAAPQRIAEAFVYPQPARDQVHFQYDLDSVSDVHIKIMNRKGETISEVTETSQSGRASAAWDARGVAPGTYFATIHIKSAIGERRIKKTVYIQR